MKLYATVASERASKGQGGEHLDINIYDSNKNVCATLKVETYKDEVGDGIKIYIDCNDWVYLTATGENVKLPKTKKEKDE
jgi:hypothetical protein|tara:strand:+ start:4020 stop:4259 length:240 start_codon:yes stop_codon:yes gene_type:complete